MSDPDFGPEPGFSSFDHHLLDLFLGDILVDEVTEGALLNEFVDEDAILGHFVKADEEVDRIFRIIHVLMESFFF